jgi:hypothetical protein
MYSERNVDEADGASNEFPSITDSAMDDIEGYTLPVGGPICHLMGQIADNESLSEAMRSRLNGDVMRAVNNDRASIEQTRGGDFILQDRRSGETTVLTNNGDFVRFSSRGQIVDRSDGFSRPVYTTDGITKVHNRQTGTAIYLNSNRPENNVIVNGGVRTPLPLQVKVRSEPQPEREAPRERRPLRFV